MSRYGLEIYFLDQEVAKLARDLLGEEGTVRYFRDGAGWCAWTRPSIPGFHVRGGLVMEEHPETGRLYAPVAPLHLRLPCVKAMKEALLIRLGERPQ